mmetsp:Transcript_38301/g.68386  ORF Transcript_38301/g.68386 Transcript_38301/m.68386 type:complete len:773 (-) Transcript_38301:14-2332(-)
MGSVGAALGPSKGLHGRAHLVQQRVSRRLQPLVWIILQEDLGPPNLAVHWLESQLFNELPEVRPGAGGQEAEPRAEVLVGQADGEAVLPDPHRLQDARALQLRHHLRPGEHTGAVGVVGLDAADPVGLRAVDGVQQLLQAVGERPADRLGAALRPRGVRLGVRPQQARHERGRRVPQDHPQLRLQRVEVLVADVLVAVPDLAGVVGDAEGAVPDAGLAEGLVPVVLGLSHVQELIVGPVFDLVVQQVKQPHFGSDEIQGGLVVGGGHAAGIDALSAVLRQVPLEDAAVVVLLEPLVAVVDAELLEEVVPEVLEAEDIQQPDPLGGLGGRLAIQHFVQAPDDVLEGAVVQRLGHGVPDLAGLCGGMVDGEGVPADVGRRGGQLRQKAVHVAAPEAAHELQPLEVLIRQVRFVLQRGELQGLQMGNPRDDGVDAAHLLLPEAHDAESLPDGGVVGRVAGHVLLRPRDPFEEPVELAGGVQAEGRPVGGRGPRKELVEGVVAALSLGVPHYPAALQEVVRGVGPVQVPLRAELQLHELPEAAAVVVPQRLGVPKGLKDRAGDVDLLRQGRGPGLVLRGRVVGGGLGQVPKHDLGPLRLAGPTLPGDEHGLGSVGGAHAPVGVVGHGPVVNGELGLPVQGLFALLNVEGHSGVAVEGQVVAEGVQGEDDGADLRVDSVHPIPPPDLLQQQRVVQDRHLQQVLHRLQPLILHRGQGGGRNAKRAAWRPIRRPGGEHVHRLVPVALDRVDGAEGPAVLWVAAEADGPWLEGRMLPHIH